MAGFINTLLRYRTIVLILLAASLAAGIFGALKLDVEAYPDPSPPLVEIITQNPAWSAEEMEQQVTAPIEVTLNGTPQLEQIRSISIFGLSDVKLYFKFSSDLLICSRNSRRGRLPERYTVISSPARTLLTT